MTQAGPVGGPEDQGRGLVARVMGARGARVEVASSSHPHPAAIAIARVALGEALAHAFPSPTSGGHHHASPPLGSHPPGEEGGIDHHGLHHLLEVGLLLGDCLLLLVLGLHALESQHLSQEG